MRLGIVVVYLFGDENEALLETHLGRIARHTTVPYTIYGSVNRLAPKYRTRLAQRPDVKICPIPDTELRAGPEHAYYLDHLVRYAIEDGSTHVVTLHLDSFPVRTGWAEAIADRLSEKRPLATLHPVNTACLLFPRDFYLRHHPTMRVEDDVRESAPFLRYLDEHETKPHSGTGYGFLADQLGLECLYLRSDDTAIRHTVFDDLIVHLGGAVFQAQAEDGLERGGSWTALYVRRILPRVVTLAGALIPQRLRRAVKTRVPWVQNTLVARPMRRNQVQRIDAYLDPEGPEAGHP